MAQVLLRLVLAWLLAMPVARAESIYAATDDKVAQTTEAQAAQTIVEIAQRSGFRGVVVFGPEIRAFSAPSWVKSLTVTSEGLVVVHEKGRIERRFADLPPIQVISDTALGFSQYGVPVSEDEVLWVIDGGINGDWRREHAIRLADALHALRKLSVQSVQDDAKFAAAAEQYRALAAKPALPEAARRFRVQAEFALDQKRYGDAAALYGEGLRVAPWWAQGRFNRALVLAEIGRHNEAIAEMRRYLVLEPGAPDVRLAQDRIYQWELSAKLGQSSRLAVADGGPKGGILATTRGPSGGGAGGCFVATAAYGSALHPKVAALREFRDRNLAASWPGAMLVAAYYEHSPPIADAISRSEPLRVATRWALWPVVFAVTNPRIALFALVLTGALATRIVRRRR